MTAEEGRKPLFSTFIQHLSEAISSWFVFTISVLLSYSKAGVQSFQRFNAFVLIQRFNWFNIQLLINIITKLKKLKLRLSIIASSLECLYWNKYNNPIVSAWRTGLLETKDSETTITLLRLVSEYSFSGYWEEEKVKASLLRPLCRSCWIDETN